MATRKKAKKAKKSAQRARHPSTMELMRLEIAQARDYASLVHGVVKDTLTIVQTIADGQPAMREAIERLDRTVAALGNNSLTLASAPPAPVIMVVNNVEPNDVDLLS